MDVGKYRIMAKFQAASTANARLSSAIGKWALTGFSKNADAPARIARSLSAASALFRGRADAHRERHPHEVGNALGLHLLHQMRAVDLHRSRRDFELIGDELVRAAGDELLEHLSLAGGQLGN